MPKYTNANGKINLDDYKQVRELNEGKIEHQLFKLNTVSLWQHKLDSNLKIVIKRPKKVDPDVANHNIRAINAFFGDDSAWYIEGEAQGMEGFAMKYYDGSPLSPREEEQLDAATGCLTTIAKNGLLFTMLDRNKENFLKLPNGEIIPTGFDYIIINNGTELLDYQKRILDHRRDYRLRVSSLSDEGATEYVLDSYPAVAPYLYEQWGKAYLKTDKYKNSTIYQPRVPGPTEKNYNESIKLLTQKIADFQGKPECLIACYEAIALQRALNEEGEKYFSGELSKERYKEFKEKCEGHIKTARLELDQHRGYKKILLNILGIVASAGIGYAIAAGLNIAWNRGKFTFFSTDSSIKIDSIEECINQIDPMKNAPTN